MTRQTISIIFLFILMTIIMGFNCGKEFNEPRSPSQNFTEMVSLTPAQKIYKINDTIWLTHIAAFAPPNVKI